MVLELRSDVYLAADKIVSEQKNLTSVGSLGGCVPRFRQAFYFCEALCWMSEHRQLVDGAGVVEQWQRTCKTRGKERSPDPPKCPNSLKRATIPLFLCRQKSLTPIIWCVLSFWSCSFCPFILVLFSVASALIWFYVGFIANDTSNSTAMLVSEIRATKKMH